VRIAVTRAREDASALAARLESLGHDVEICPLIEIEPAGPEGLDVSGYDWVVVTSRNGARELARRMRGRPGRIAAIGPGTAEALPAPPDLVPAVSTQEGLLAELPRPAGRVLFAGAEGARRLLVDELGADFVPLYRTRELRPADFPEVDLVLLASASAARAYAALGVCAPAISVGPQTTAAARELGVEVVGEAETYDLDGLVEAVRRMVPPCSSPS
jgi:uroporphyrinogen III methyltransferase/synthase